MAQLKLRAGVRRKTSPAKDRNRPCRAVLAFGLLVLLAATVAVANEAKPAGQPPTQQSQPQPLPTGQSSTVQIVADAAYFDTLVTLIRNARQRIDLAMFLFKTTTARNNRPTRLVEELVRARQRGVHVRVILDLSGHDKKITAANQETGRLLEKEGITVLFDSPRRTNHTKLVVIDGRHCLVGSHNLTHSALTNNHEFSLLLDNPHLAGAILAYMDTIVK